MLLQGRYLGIFAVITMWIKYGIVYVMFIVLSMDYGQCRRARPTNDCPEACFCNTISKIVYCSRRGLTTIPESLPKGSRQLNLNGNTFEIPILQKSNFSKLSGLEHLYMSECSIERIDVGAFEDMVNLEWLDLSNNRISRIEDFTFRGLSLMHLFLNGNRNLKLESKSFQQMSTTGLYLHECSLSRLEFNTFQPLNGTLEYLWLNGNELDEINKKFLPLFSTLSHLRLGSNPIHCNCRALWLKELFDTKGAIFQGSDAPSCLTPQKLKGRMFNTISLFDFTCSAPVFKNMDAVIEEEHRMLRCTAHGDPTPTLFWISPRGKSFKYSPKNMDDKINHAVLNISALNVPKEDISGQYFCLALNEAGNMTFTFNISWPYFAWGTTKTTTVKEPIKSSPTPAQISSTVPTVTVFEETQLSTTEDVFEGDVINLGNDLEIDQSQSSNQGNNIVRNNKQENMGSENVNSNHSAIRIEEDKKPRLYTLPELIGAVVGTHVCTLILCLVVIPVFFKKKWKKKRNSSLEKPPLKGEPMYLAPAIDANQYEGKITKTYRDYYFDSPSPIKR